MAMPPLPEGFDWKVEFRVGKDATDRSDHAKYTGFYWGDDRFLDQDKGLKAVIFLRQNGVILLRRRSTPTAWTPRRSSLRPSRPRLWRCSRPRTSTAPSGCSTTS